MLRQIITLIIIVSGVNCLKDLKDANLMKLVETVEKLNKKLDMVDRKNILLQDKNQKLENQLNTMQTKLNNMEQTNKMMTKRQAQEMVSPIAFTASLTPAKQVLGQHQAIEYDHVITNLGNAYDPRHGHFTAPVKGLYLISVTLMSPYGSNPNDIFAELVKNGVIIIPLYASHPDSDSTSSTIFLTLNAGDMVWIRSSVRASETIHGSGYDTFSGLLISQM